MLFEDKIKANKEAYYLAKKRNKLLSKEVKIRNSIKNILIGSYTLR